MFLPSKVCDKIHSWSMTMQDGDKIVRKGNTISIYNSSGCELDSITF
jgi:hypothetical protein